MLFNCIPDETGIILLCTNGVEVECRTDFVFLVVFHLVWLTCLESFSGLGQVMWKNDVVMSLSM